MGGNRIAAGIAMCLAAPALSQPAEWLGQAPLDGLVIAHQLARDGSMIVERIPPGESVQRWTRMATTQRFAGVIARGSSLDEWYGHFMGGLANGCPGYRSAPPARLQIAGRPALAFRVDCPRNPATGLPETFLLRAIAGGSDLHVTQVAFRRVPSATDIAWASGHLDSVTLCTVRSPAPVCRAGPEAFDR